MYGAIHQTSGTYGVVGLQPLGVDGLSNSSALRKLFDCGRIATADCGCCLTAIESQFRKEDYARLVRSGLLNLARQDRASVLHYLLIDLRNQIPDVFVDAAMDVLLQNFQPDAPQT